MVIVHWGDQSKHQSTLTTLLFLGFLPLFNVPLDWLSFGFTRGLLYSIKPNEDSWLHILLVGILDVIIAVVFLVLVIGSTWFSLWLVNSLASLGGADPVINIQSLWLQVRDGDWQKSLWIWLMLGSTLIPTLVHFMVALFAFTIVLPHKFTAKTAIELQRRRQEFLAGNKDVVIGNDQQFWAFLFIMMRFIMLFGFVALLLFVAYLLMTTLPDLESIKTMIDDMVV